MGNIALPIVKPNRANNFPSFGDALCF